MTITLKVVPGCLSAFFPGSEKRPERKRALSTAITVRQAVASLTP